MPRKVTSSGVSTQGRKTSINREMGLSKSHGQRSTVADGGKWAGEGRKTVEKHERPKLTRQGQPGRGPKTRTSVRTAKRNHPNRGK